MQNLKEEVIKFAQKLNSSNLSPLRSGNVSIRTTINNIEGFLITPLGRAFGGARCAAVADHPP